jgi:hypothetical protein
MVKKQYHKSEKVLIVCPECYREVWGISKKQTIAVMREHKRSTLHKKIAHALKQDKATRINPEINEEAKTAE